MLYIHRKIALTLLVTICVTVCNPLFACTPFTQQLTGSQEMIQEFKVNNTIGTAWRVFWGESSGDRKVLYIKEAWYKRNLSEEWIKVLGDSRISQIFVPYHNGVEKDRYYDLGVTGGLSEVVAGEAGSCGELAPKVKPQSGGNPRHILVREIRDYGLVYRTGYDHLENIPPFVYRRGQALILWASYWSGNYNAIIEYGFRDDGVITFRLGSTGFNNPNMLKRVSHMHNALWRIDIDLGGADGDSVFVSEHIEPSDNIQLTKAMDKGRDFNGGVEGAEDWDPKKFTTLIVQDKNLKNRYGHNINYVLLSNHSGIARHFGVNLSGKPDEDFALHDYWVTENNSSEVDYKDINSYVSPPSSIKEKDVVLWTMTSAHHLPRDEDFGYPDRVGLEYLPSEFANQQVQVGGTHIMWSGFMLRPHNFFDNTPLMPLGPGFILTPG